MKFILIVLLFVLNKTWGYTIKNCKHEAFDTNDSTDNFKCYNGGICYRLEHNASQVLRLCTCKPGFTGKQCEQSSLTPCSPDPCSPNGYCNAQPDSIGYYCQCKPGFTGPTCAENINDCLNATCFNGGLCIDGINSYQCDCQWPYIGRYCQTKMKCTTDGVCKNNAICIQDESTLEPRCVCKPGYEGVDCSTKVDQCKSNPCHAGSSCISIQNDYQCNCPIGYMGKNCDQQDVCIVQRPCQNNSTCVSLTINREQKYYCDCQVGFTGTDCASLLATSTITTRTTATQAESTSANTVAKQTDEDKLNDTINDTKGAFVLMVNINPSEFVKREREIIGEFEKRFGIMMSIKKDNSQTKMIYPFRPENSSSSNQLWTKVYFIFISACIQHENNGQLNNKWNETTKSLCLQNNVENLNDVSQVLEQLKKASDLYPKYVSNVSYEAYSDSKRSDNVDQFSPRPSADSTLTLTLCFLSVALLVGISLALTVIIKQQRRVKAPVWFPPIGDNDSNIKTISSNFVFDCDKTKKMSTCVDPWSLGTKMSEMTNKTKIDLMSVENEYGEMKTRRVNASPSSTSSCLSMPVPAVPDFYPSPPESLPESFGALHPANYRTGSIGLTPLMLFVLGRSKQNKLNDCSSSQVDLIDSFVNSGADLNTQNNEGETALHLAARSGLYEICDRLIKHKAEMNSFDAYGRNVLHTAVCANQYKIVKLILDHCNSVLCANNTLNQANLLLDDKYDLIDSKTNDDLGDTSLIIACRLSLNSIVQLLVDYNATVNATDNEGRSALHWCAKVNNVCAASILLKSGANVNMQDNDERTPLTSGLNEMCTLPVADLLIKYDAFVSADDEIKYNKMKSIMEAMSGVKTLPRDIKTVKSGAIMAPPADKLLKSAPTKRKLNETSATMESRGAKNKRPSVVKKQNTTSPPPLQPPPSYTTAQSMYSTLPAKFTHLNQYAQDNSQTAYDYSSYYYDSNYSYSNQQFYLSPGSGENKFDSGSTAGNVNMGYMSDSSFNFANVNQYQVKQETHGQQNPHLYSSQYAAYF